MTAWHEHVELVAEVFTAVPTGAGRWNQALWGTGKWSRYAGDWQPVDCEELVSLTFGLTRPSLADNFGVGGLTMTVRNAGGWATGNPITGQLTIVPGTPIRITARTIGGTWRTIWVGEIDSLTSRWDTDGAVLTTIHGADTLAQLAAVDPPKTNVPVDSVASRLGRIAAMTGRDKLTFFAGTGGLGDGRLDAGTVDQQLVTEAMLAVNSFAAVIAASPSVADRIVYVVSNMNVSPGTPAGCPFWVTNQDPAGAPVPVCPLTFEADGPDVSTIANEINLSRAGGTVQTRRNQTSIDQFKLRNWGRSDLLNQFDTDVATVADAHLKYRHWPRARFTVTYHVPDSFPAGANQRYYLSEWLRYAIHPLAPIEANVAGALPVRVWWVNDSDHDTPWTIDVAGWATGITHAVTPDAWVTTLEIDQPGTTLTAAVTEDDEQVEQEAVTV